MNKAHLTYMGAGLVAAMALAACTAAQADEVQTEAPLTSSSPLPSPSLSIADIEPDQAGDDRYTEFRQRFQAHQALSNRVARISRRLRVANAFLCDETRLDVGLSTHQLTDYPQGARPLALHFLPLEEEGRFIRNVVPGSPADDAELRAGEEILSGWPIAEASPLIIATPNGDQPVQLAPDLACIAPTYVVASDRLNASTDGEEIELSSALVEQVGDDAALALIIAHEMGHVLRGHTADMSRWTMELQADSDALILMHNAGYDISETVASWEAGVEIHRESQSLSATHPPVQIRLRNLQDRLNWIEAAPDGPLPLP